MDSIWNQLEHIAGENNGIITTAQVKKADISRTALKRYVDEQQLVRICNGLYVLEYGMADEYVRFLVLVSIPFLSVLSLEISVYSFVASIETG